MSSSEIDRSYNVDTFDNSNSSDNDDSSDSSDNNKFQHFFLTFFLTKII